MATYIPAYKGYIADVPRVWFKRCDGRIFYFDEITQSQATPNTQFIDINAGWSIFPVAQIPGQSTMEISLTSGQFNTDLFELNSQEFSAIDSDYDTWFTETVEFDNEGAAILTYAPKAVTDIYIKGITEDEGTTVEIDQQNTKKITVEYKPDPTGQAVALEGEVEVSYLVTIDNGSVSVVDTQNAVMGEALLRWPVYSASADCADSDVKGYVEMKVFRCRVTQAPGFDSSYKSAGTHQITLATMDAKRADGNSYSVAYIEFPSTQGN